MIKLLLVDNGYIELLINWYIELLNYKYYLYISNIKQTDFILTHYSTTIELVPFGRSGTHNHRIIH